MTDQARSSWQTLNSAIDGWFTSGEANAAGRLGLFRIFYCLFSLWYLSLQHSSRLGDIPASFAYHRIRALDWFPSGLSAHSYMALEQALVISLVLLLFGLFSRWATAAVLVFGFILEGSFARVNIEHSTALMAVIIPGVMLVMGDWSAKYSVDSLLRERRGGTPVSASATDARFVAPIRTMLAITAVLYVSSGLFKLPPGSDWLIDDQKLVHAVLERNVLAHAAGHFGNPFAGEFAHFPWLGYLLQWLVMLIWFSAAFIVFSHRFRRLFLAFVCFFHAVGALALLVTFTPVAIVYPLFLDLEKHRRRFGLNLGQGLLRQSPAFLVGVPIALAIAVGGLWNTSAPIRDVLNLWGLVDLRTVWIPLLPLTIVAMGWAGIRSIRPQVA